MAEIRKTPRRCEKCLENGNTNYLDIQDWGMEGKKKLYRLTCREHGHIEDTTWDGR